MASSRQFGTAAAAAAAATAVSDGTATLRSLQGTTSSFKPQPRLSHHEMNAPLVSEKMHVNQQHTYKFNWEKGNQSQYRSLTDVG